MIRSNDVTLPPTLNTNEIPFLGSNCGSITLLSAKKSHVSSDWICSICFNMFPAVFLGTSWCARPWRWHSLEPGVDWGAMFQSGVWTASWYTVKLYLYIYIVCKLVCDLVCYCCIDVYRVWFDMPCTWCQVLQRFMDWARSELASQWSLLLWISQHPCPRLACTAKQYRWGGDT